MRSTAVKLFPGSTATAVALCLLLPFLASPDPGGVSGEGAVPGPMKAPWADWTLVAQQPHPDSRERTVRAVRATGPIEIDGRLDEAAWREAPAASSFTQVEPLEGLGALEETEVRILYDDENLYVGARMYDSDPGRIARQLTPRGVTGDAAGFFELSLDPNFDRTTGYTFQVTAANVQGDQFHYDDTQSDDSWDGIWESAVTVDDAGWVAEIRIPLSQLRFDAHSEPQVWGVNFARRRIAANERAE